MRIREAAELLGVSDDTVRQWIDDGALSTSKDDAGHDVIAGQVLAEFWRHNAQPLPPNPLGHRQLGAESLCRSGHRRAQRHRHDAGRDPMRTAQGRVPDEHPGGT